MTTIGVRLSTMTLISGTMEFMRGGCVSTLAKRAGAIRTPQTMFVQLGIFNYLARTRTRFYDPLNNGRITKGPIFAKAVKNLFWTGV